MSDTIRLHPEHGLNPTISQCIVCHKDKNEIVLLGAAYEGQAPMHMVMDIEPCDDCRTKYLKEGVLLVEVNDEQNKIPTGSIVVLKESAFTRIFNCAIPAKRICFVEVGILQKLQGK